MGVLRSIFSALLGPLLIWGILMLHVAYQHGFKTPDPMPKPYWPEHVKDDMKTAIIANRKYIVQDLQDVFAYKLDGQKFLKNRATEDITWEDPLQRFDGADDVGLFLGMLKHFTGWKFNIRSEVHSAHEILVDWDITFALKLVPSLPITMGMRTHIMMEPTENAGGSEKIFRIAEDWGGNPQLNEKTVKLTILGKVHQNLRQFAGHVIVWPLRNVFT